MSDRKTVQKKVEEKPQQQEEVNPPEAVDTQDIDNLLDEIDDVLEENAEEFVKNFVQRGGE